MAVKKDNSLKDELNLHTMNQQLRESNQQLIAAEQQLKAANQQLRAQEQQLQAANQQLDASNQQLRAMNQQLKLDERKLKQSHQKLLDIIDFLPDATFVVDKSGKIIAWNRALEKMTGVSKEQIIGKGDHAYSVPFYGQKRLIMVDLLGIDDQETEKRYDYVKRTGKIIESQTFAPLLNQGKGAHILITTAPLFDQEGNLLGAIECVRDITEQKRAEQALKFQAMLLDQIQSHVIATDLKGRITYVNSAVSSRMGLKKDDLIGKKTDVLGENPQLGATQKQILQQTITQGHWHGEVVNYTSDGEEFILDCKTYEVYDADGKKTGLCSVSRDITELKQNEKQLLKYQHQLQDLVSQLSIAEEKERKRIASKLHDDICQDMVFLKMSVDSAISKTTSEKQRKTLKEISKTIANLLADLQNITNDLGSNLLYELGLKSALKEWIDREIKDKHKLNVVFNCDEDYSNLDTDIRTFLFRSIKELMINVVKHANAANINVSLTSQGSLIKVRVDDDGIGLKDPQDNIADDYKKGGYGLFSVKERLNYFGGEMKFINQKSPGARIEMAVPRKQQENDSL